MQNVIQFPVKSTSTDIDLTGFLKLANVPQLIEDFIQQMCISCHLQNLDEEVKHLTSWKYAKDISKNEDGIFLETIFRKEVAPLFGCQKYRKYLGVNYFYSDLEPEIERKTTDLFNQMELYFDLYPKVESDNLQYCFALLAGMIVHPDSAFIFSQIVDEVYTVNFVKRSPTDKGWLYYTFWVDLLPLVLDEAACNLIAKKDEVNL